MFSFVITGSELRADQISMDAETNRHILFFRISEFFDIIVECPESTPAVNDLKTCVEWTGQREQLQVSILAA